MIFKKIILILLFSCIILSCSEDSGGNPKVDLDKEALLTNYADNLIIPSFELMYSNILVLEQRFEDLETGYDESKANKLRQAFHEVRKNWQHCSPYGFGPAEEVLLRQAINTFPTDTNRIKDNISTGEYSLATSSNFKAKGFPALDYLLYSVELKDEATKFSEKKRLDYIKDLINDIKTNVEYVRSEWPSYREEFISKTGNDVGSSLSQMINEFMYDYEITKNARLAIPIGLRSTDILPYNFEAPYSQLSSNLLSEVLETHKEFIEGPENNEETKTDNLYEYLNEISATRGDSLLADVILREFDETVLVFNRIDVSFFKSVYVESQRLIIEDIYKNMQETTALLKNDMTSALGIRITYQDNDGD